MEKFYEKRQENFKGLCVSGPLDGQMLEHNTTTYRVIIEPKVGPKVRPSYLYGAVDRTNYEIKQYSYHTGIRGLLNIDFWLFDGMKIEDAFAIIINVYAAAVKKK